MRPTNLSTLCGRIGSIGLLLMTGAAVIIFYLALLLTLVYPSLLFISKILSLYYYYKAVFVALLSVMFCTFTESIPSPISLPAITSLRVIMLCWDFYENQLPVRSEVM